MTFQHIHPSQIRFLTFENLTSKSNLTHGTFSGMCPERKSPVPYWIQIQTNLHQTLLVSDRFSSLRSNIFGSLSLLNKNDFAVPDAVIILSWWCQLRQTPKTEAALEAHAD